jgi:hypothetical protein
MRLFRIIAGIITLMLPMWIVFAMCATYVLLSGWLIFWVAQYAAHIAILMITPAAVAGLLFLAVCVGGEILDNTRLRAWCDRRGEKYLPAFDAPIGNS